MKILVSIASLCLFAQVSLANTAHYNCSYEDIKNISNYFEGATTLSERQLTESEQVKMENAFDNEYDCDEGVELLGSIKTPDGADYLATCWKDSLGSNQVSLPQTCVAE